MACTLFPCGQPDLASFQTLISINGVPYVGQPGAWSFDFGDIDCCGGGVYDLTLVWQNNLIVSGDIQPISIDGIAAQQICWPPLFNGSPCLDDNCNGQVQVLSYTAGLIPFGGQYTVVVRITPNCVNCCVSDLQNVPNNLVIYLANPDDANDTCCQLVVPMGYDINNRQYTITSGPITAITSTCECIDTLIDIRNDSCETRDLTFSLFNCNGYLSLIGQTAFPAVAPQQTVQLTLRYCPLQVELANCDLVLNDECPNDLFFPINVESVQCPPEQAICLNCDFLSINQVQLAPCDSQCVNIGDTISLYGNVGFPIRTFAIIAADNILNTFTIFGDYTAGFVAGTLFNVAGSTCNDGAYTVVSSVFNGTNTIVTVTGPVLCNTGDGAIEDIQYCEPAVDPCDPCVPAPCFQTVHILIENQDTGQIIFDQTFVAVSNNYLVNFLHTIISFGTYHILIEACDCFGCRKCEWFLEACFQYEIKKSGCHTYNIFDNQLTPTKINTVVITNQSGTYSVTYTFDTSITNFLPIGLPADGIYTVTISNSLTSDVQSFVIFDFCDFITCYRKLILELFCNEGDPCCKECNEEEKRRMEQLRGELNKMIALAGTLFAFIERDRIIHLGVFTMDECRELDLQLISDIFDKLNEITFRCGECKKTTLITPSPCPTC